MRQLPQSAQARGTHSPTLFAKAIKLDLLIGECLLCNLCQENDDSFVFVCVT
jgi:hypothetical protein